MLAFQTHTPHICHLVSLALLLVAFVLVFVSVVRLCCLFEHSKQRRLMAVRQTTKERVFALSLFVFALLWLAFVFAAQKQSQTQIQKQRENGEQE